MAQEINNWVAEQQELETYGKPLLSWRIHEYPFYQRDKRWYVMFGAVVLVLLFLVLTPASFWPTMLSEAPILRNFFFTTADYTFAILIVLISIVVIINGRTQPLEVDFIIMTEGIIIGQRFYDYDTFKEFAIIYKPAERLKVLYLENKNSFMPRLSIPLGQMDPVEVRRALLKYLDEDLVRTDESNSDYFSRFFKI